MFEIGISFSGPMVRAIIEGRKTQTRRVIKPQPPIGERSVVEGVFEGNARYSLVWHAMSDMDKLTATPDDLRASLRAARCPYGAPGTMLWVRESWAVYAQYDRLPPSRLPAVAREHVWYLADGQKPTGFGRARAGRFMPRWACRLTLRVSRIHAERLVTISEHDALLEGYPPSPGALKEDRRPLPIAWFKDKWDHINGDNSWWDNPWVWVLDFDPQGVDEAR